MVEVLITGATGLAGRSLVPSLLRAGHAVRALVRTPHDARTLEQRGAVACLGDVRELASLEQASAGCDVVVHAAAAVAFGARIRRLREVNVGGTDNALSAARSGGVRRFVLIGAAATLLGDRPVLDADESWPHPVRSIGPYTKTKAEAEQLVLAANDDGLETIVLRPSALWGPRAIFVNEVVRVCRSKTFSWIEGGEFPFSVCHVDNLAAAVGFALHRGQGGQSYLIADAESTSFREFVTALLHGIDLSPPTRSAPRWLMRAIARLVEVVSYPFVGRSSPPLSREMIATIAEPIELSIAKATRELGYQPVLSRTEAIARLREWYLPGETSTESAKAAS